jgi:hypothetical protein
MVLSFVRTIEEVDGDADGLRDFTEVKESCLLCHGMLGHNESKEQGECGRWTHDVILNV